MKKELDGISKSYYDNGNLKTEYSYKDGKRHGVFRLYDEDGDIKVEGYFINDVLDKKRFKTYHKNGKLKSEIKNGNLIIYDDNYKDFIF